MSKFLGNNQALLLVFFLFLTISLVSTLLFINPTTSKAQTYQSLNCPTPQPGKSVLQLVPCTPSGEVDPTPFTSQQSTVSNTVSQPAVQATSVPSSGTESGEVCTPDSRIANGSSCNCPSDLEPDAVCTVASESVCTQNRGYPASYGEGLLGIVSGGLTNSDTNSNGTYQCLWLDSSPVPAAANATNCSIECNSKPVLYFYSPTTLSINVSLDIPGFITKSIPSYPAGGWQDVIVHPTGTADGTLSYNNQTYKELYYEDATIKAQPPTQGFVIKTTDLETSLRTYTAELGLTTGEQNEFISYWVPRLTDLKAPYIFFTVFDQTQKEKVDDVIVSPKPTTTIAFLAYFKPLQQAIQVAPLQFPTVPQRQGFTEVEWGGTIDESN